MKINKYIISKTLRISALMICSLVAGSIVLSSCEEDLPEAGSVKDLTPPSADFSFSVDNEDHLKLNFSNLSASATDFSWDFGDGNTSIEEEPSNTFPSEGTYTVSLTAMDKLGAKASISHDVEIVAPELYEPFILEPSFEDGQLEDNTGDGRDSWRNSDLGGVIQITSGPTRTGEQAAKLPSAGDRIGYQLVTVIPDSDYIVKFYYTMKESGDGSVTVAILGGAVTNPDDIAGATIASITVDDQTDSDAYVGESISFNSGDNSEIAIYFTNVGVESRLEDFSIENDTSN